jgi:hypothetical protein
MPDIVTVNVSLLTPPPPATLQQTGAFVSVGGTNYPPNTLNLITTMADLVPHIIPPRPIATITWAGGIATYTTSTPHGMQIGDTLVVATIGAIPAGYNQINNITVTGASAFTRSIPADPGGPATTKGTWQPYDSAEITNMAKTFFAQGVAQSVYVLELGINDDAGAIGVLTTWLQNNPLRVYGLLFPRWWNGSTALLNLAKAYSSTTSMLYFWITVPITNYGPWMNLKSVFMLAEAPAGATPFGVLQNEFSLAAAFYHALAYRPSNTNRVAPFCFSYTIATTPYPTVSNAVLLATLKSVGVNVIATAAEGGLANSMIEWGVTADLRDYTYWYSIDYTTINSKLNLANEVIQGSNNPVNPLYYNQQGINRLQGRLAQQMASEVTYGLAEGTVIHTEFDSVELANALDNNALPARIIVNAIPFVDYVTANPSDYRTGIYRGLTIVYIPARGFTQIVLNVIASDFLNV